ncbi:MAG: helix-turn-helix domain-containing protein [Mongoliitalea sp.]
MKQPQLGQKIQEWRKAKGLTQEELVERCNINVRTIQRIEAGEVTPRSYTVKAILEALGIENEDHLSLKNTHESIQFSPQLQKTFLIAAISGSIYFLISFLEFYWDGALAFQSSLEIPSYYIPLKVAVLITFSFFFWGWLKFGETLNSGWIRWGALLLILVNIAIIAMDISLVENTQTDYKFTGFVKLFSFGFSLIPISIGLILNKEQMGVLFLIAGIAGLLASLALMTIIFAVVGLIIITVFDVLLIYILFSTAFQKEDRPI